MSTGSVNTHPGDQKETRFLNYTYKLIKPRVAGFPAHIGLLSISPQKFSSACHKEPFQSCSLGSKTPRDSNHAECQILIWKQHVSCSGALIHVRSVENLACSVLKLKSEFNYPSFPRGNSKGLNRERTFYAIWRTSENNGEFFF